MNTLAQQLRNMKEKTQTEKAKARWDAIRAIIDDFVSHSATQGSLPTTDEDNPRAIFDPYEAIAANAIPIVFSHIWKQEMEFMLRTLGKLSGLSVAWDIKERKFYLSLPSKKDVVVLISQESTSDENSATNDISSKDALSNLAKQLGHRC